MVKYKKENRGFTLVELILYVALVSVFVTSAIMFSWDVIYGREKAYKQQVVQQVSRMVMARIGYEISIAKDIQNVQSESISLIRDDGTNVLIAKSDNEIQITIGTQGPYALTSNEVAINALQFTNLTATNNNTKNINVALNLRQANNTSKGELTSETNVTGTFELKGRFNIARSILMDTTNLSLPAGTSIAGIEVQNLGDTDTLISKIKVTWTNSTGDNITGITIGGADVWTGSSPSGTELSLSGVTIPPGTTTVNSITFGSSQFGEVVDLQFTLSDGSNSFAKLFLPSSGATASPTVTPSPGVSPTVTPSPTPSLTPTPTPAGSCNQICLANSFSSGTCRRNAAACTSGGETYVSGGDVYCTGGPNADTCCCLP